MTEDIRNTFKEKIYECDRHVEKIIIAVKHLGDLFPLKESCRRF